MKLLRTTLLLLGLIFCGKELYAQDTLSNAKTIKSSDELLIQKYKTEPVWIQMMEDPNVNYYEACKAFKLFWEGKEIPAETEGESNALYEKEGEGEKGLNFSDPESYKYIYQYKRFTYWQRENAKWVNSQTGHIMTEEEKMKLWRSMQK